MLSALAGEFCTQLYPSAYRENAMPMQVPASLRTHERVQRTQCSVLAPMFCSGNDGGPSNGEKSWHPRVVVHLRNHGGGTRDVRAGAATQQ